MAEQCCTQAVNVLLKFIRYRRTSRLAPLFNHILQLPKSNDKVVAEICIVEYTMTTVAHAKKYSVPVPSRNLTGFENAKPSLTSH